MNTSLVDVGEKIMIQVAPDNKDKGRIFRFLIGEVTRANEHGIRITGYTFYCDLEKGQFLRRKTPMSFIVSLSDQRFLYIVLPRNVNIDELSFSMEEEPALKLGSQYKIIIKDLIQLRNKDI